MNQMTDEDILAQVQQAMGGQGGSMQGAPAAQPPPGSGMKWENLEEDQQALMNDPSPENVQAFVQYWGQENLPKDLEETGPGEPGTMAEEQDEGEY